MFDEITVDLIKRTVAQNATDDELEMFLYQASKMGLDPLARQIHFQKYHLKDGTSRVSFITTIDGYRVIANRTGVYAGNDEPLFSGKQEIADTQRYDKVKSAPEKASVTVWKIVKGNRVSFTASAYWEEYYPGGTKGHMWRKMPRVMLAKVAEASALRKAFPNDLSGAYIEEEMEQAEWQTVPKPNTNVQKTHEIAEDDHLADQLPNEETTERKFSEGDEVQVQGKNGVKKGTVKGFDNASNLYLVDVNGVGALTLSEDKLSMIQDDFDDIISVPQMQAMHVRGNALFAKAWDEKRHNVISAITDGKKESSKELNGDEYKQVMDYLDVTMKSVVAGQNSFIEHIQDVLQLPDRGDAIELFEALKENHVANNNVGVDVGSFMKASFKYMEE